MPDSWDTMDARARDAWVEEHVMDGDVRVTVFLGPPPPESTEPRHFTTDPTADYAVLCRVRDTWDWQAKRAFCQQLHALMCEVHLDDDTSNMPLAFACYAPGLYSRAAYEVLTKHESDKQ